MNAIPKIPFVNAAAGFNHPGAVAFHRAYLSQQIPQGTPQGSLAAAAGPELDPGTSFRQGSNKRPNIGSSRESPRGRQLYLQDLTDTPAVAEPMDVGDAGVAGIAQLGLSQASLDRLWNDLRQPSPKPVFRRRTYKAVKRSSNAKVDWHYLNMRRYARSHAMADLKKDWRSKAAQYNLAKKYLYEKLTKTEFKRWTMRGPRGLNKFDAIFAEAKKWAKNMPAFRYRYPRYPSHMYPTQSASKRQFASNKRQSVRRRLNFN